MLVFPSSFSMFFLVSYFLFLSSFVLCPSYSYPYSPKKITSDSTILSIVHQLSCYFQAMSSSYHSHAKLHFTFIHTHIHIHLDIVYARSKLTPFHTKSSLGTRAILFLLQPSFCMWVGLNMLPICSLFIHVNIDMSRHQRSIVT